MNKHIQGKKGMTMLTRYRLTVADSSRSTLQSGDINCSDKISLQWNTSRTLGFPSILQNVFVWMVVINPGFLICCTRHQKCTIDCKSVFGKQIPYSLYNIDNVNDCTEGSCSILATRKKVFYHFIFQGLNSVFPSYSLNYLKYMLGTVQSLTKFFSKKTWWKEQLNSSTYLT